MKRRKILLNLIIFLVAIFFAYQVFSYINKKTDEKKSVEIYSQIEEKSTTEDEKIDFNYLKSINPEIIAWIKSSEGSIDYPIVKSSKDNSFYLRHDVSGNKNIFASIFMDYRNNGIHDDFVLIYGHMTKNNSMFGSLNKFKENPNYKDFTFYTEDGEIKSRAVLAGIIPGESYINPKDYKDFKKRKEFYNLVKDNAVFDSSYELKEEDEMINLITCTYERKNSRLVVVTIKENH
ncbi:class B sortase [Peptoniphilus sp. MSJ-1]|uniref:Class B sortase n=1 Tax=Peptoniphilus ovalis TaxID=2841503 RepID=A0ABS6FFZ9_9FIRM|nr:class B sortase [Peptoniphilus ovalis]MBU5668447.1 class B sortase [Peptoniphilus ovalis]